MEVGTTGLVWWSPAVTRTRQSDTNPSEYYQFGRLPCGDNHTSLNILHDRSRLGGGCRKYLMNFLNWAMRMLGEAAALSRQR